MKWPFPPAAAPGLALTLMATSALADLTAQDVWNDWKELYTLSGMDTTFDEQRTDDGLRITNVKIALTQDHGGFTGTLPDLTFSELADGSVKVTLSDDFLISFAYEDATRDRTNALDLRLTQTGAQALVTGTPGDMLSTYSAGSLSIESANPMADGEPFDFDLRAAMTDIDGTWKTQSGDLKKLDSSFSTARTTLSMDMSDPEQATSVKMNAQLDGLRSTGQYDYPKGLDADAYASLSALVSQGLGFTGGYAFETMSYTLDIKDQFGTSQTKSRSGAGKVDVKLDESGLSYDGLSKDVTWGVSSSQIPFPELTLAAAEGGFGLTLPLVPSDTPEDLGLKLTLRDLTLPEQLWSMFDPAALLPRDPATLVVDLSGKARWLIDIFDLKKLEAAKDEAPEKAPGEIHALSINDLLLKVAGASLSGKGDFTFDNSDMTTFAGKPKPTGKLDLKLLGIDALFDKLAKVGLLPPEKAFGARMMLGMFARPGDAPDSLVSRIEVTESGHVLANGQRLR